MSEKRGKDYCHCAMELDEIGLRYSLFVKVPQPGDSEETFTVVK